MKKTSAALSFFVVMLVLSILGSVVTIMVNFWNQETVWLIATELEQKPDSYFLLENPDKYVLQAINSPEKTVRIVRFLDHTGIFELMSLHNTTNVEYNGSYYQFIVQLVDYYMLPVEPFLIGVFVSSAAIVIIECSKSAEKKRETEKKTQST